jgi:hypothetical protein
MTTLSTCRTEVVPSHVTAKNAMLWALPLMLQFAGVKRRNGFVDVTGADVSSSRSRKVTAARDRNCPV